MVTQKCRIDIITYISKLTLLIILFLTVIFFPSRVLAAEQLVASGTSYSSATELQYTGNGYYAQYGSGVAYFCFTTPSDTDGYTTIYFKNNNMNISSSVELMSASESRLDYNYYVSKNSAIAFNKKLEKGQKYYIKVSDGVSGGKFLLYLSYQVDNDANNKENATSVGCNQEIVSSLDGKNDCDFYSFIAEQSGLHSITYSNNGIDAGTSIEICDWNTDERLFYDYYLYSNQSTSKLLNLEKNHKYYICIRENGSAVGSYTLSINNQSVSSISLSQSQMIIKKGYYKQITASILPSGAYNKEVNWSSSNSNIASVNNKGEVSAWRPGEATITCTAKDGSNTKAECSVIVLPEKMDYLYENLSGVTSTEVKISWTRYNYISGYSIFGYDSKLNEWKVVKDDISKDIGSVSVNSTINDGKYSGLKPSTQYSYKIGAYVLSNGTKYYGELSDAVITATSPNKVKLKSVSVNNKKVKLKWKKVQDATGYKVYAKRSGSNDYFLVETIKGQKKESYTYRSSLKGKYIFTVCAYKTYNGKNYIGDGTTKKVKIK